MAVQNAENGVVTGALKVNGNVTIRYSAYDFLFDFSYSFILCSVLCSLFQNIFGWAVLCPLACCAQGQLPPPICPLLVTPLKVRKRIAASLAAYGAKAGIDRWSE